MENSFLRSAGQRGLRALAGRTPYSSVAGSRGHPGSDVIRDLAIGGLASRRTGERFDHTAFGFP